MYFMTWVDLEGPIFVMKSLSKMYKEPAFLTLRNEALVEGQTKHFLETTSYNSIVCNKND